MTTGQKVAAQLDELDSVRENFIDNLEAKGITGLIGDEKYETLVSEILNIPSGGGSGIYKVATIEERDELDPEEGDICLVYSKIIENVSENTWFNNIILPNSFTFESALFNNVDYGYINFTNESGSWDKRLEMDFGTDRSTMKSYVGISYEDMDSGIWYMNRYNTDDKITWTLEEEQMNFPIDTLIDLGENFIIEEIINDADDLKKFLNIEAISFPGLFIYKNDNWEYLDIDSRTSERDLFSGMKAYSNTGFIYGTLGDIPVSKDDLLRYNDIAVSCKHFIMPENCAGYFSGKFYDSPQDDNTLIISSLLDTSNTTNMNSMFASNYFKELDLHNLNTSKVTSMSSMFSSNQYLARLDISNFDCHLVTNMDRMFNYNRALTSIDLHGINATVVENTSEMFRDDINLINIDLRGINSSSISNSGFMFYGCHSAQIIDIRNMTLTNITNYRNMFGNDNYSYVPANCLIIVKDNTQKQWMNTNFSRLTNVKTASEYEAEQGGGS